jgi:PAS domain-containing protein
MAAQENANTDMIRSVFDSIPSIIFVVDSDVRIQEYNAMAAEFLKVQGSAILKRRGGEALYCLHSSDVPEGCGRAPFCKNCVIRNSVTEAFQGNRVVRRRSRLEIIRSGNKIEIYALITASSFIFKETPLVLLVIEDISEIAELRRMIPICSMCGKLRDDKEAWSHIETYFKDHWDVEFSHGLCPECYKVEMDKLKENVKI